jgi:ferric-dicitrate binding protein FerR (iron transport regulator)
MIKDFNSLIRKYLWGSISDEEYQELSETLAHDEYVVRRLERMAEADDLSERYAEYASVDTEAALQKFIKQYVDNGEAGKAAEMPRKPRKTMRYSLLRYAAVVALLIFGGAFWYHREYTRVTPPVITEEVQQAMEQSRESGREGAHIVSTVTSRQQIISEEECELYHVDENFAEQLAEAKRITTYHDKEYWVTLDDGTLVHLNYNSRLIYPEKFGDRRDVILEGEAYFMVAKDKSRQFVVHTPQGDVRVYGTEFMVNTAERMETRLESPTGESRYHQATSVVLIEGSISFTPESGNELMMSPGQKLVADKNQLLVTTTDTAPYVAWNTGLFVFKNSTLENLMDVISRWYGVENVSYGNEQLRKMHFTGNFKRYGSIERILDAIMMTCDINIDFHSNRITIENR